MSGFTDKLKMSRGAGFNDTQILDHLAKDPEYADKVAKSRATGQSDADIIKFLESRPEPATDPMRLAGSLARGTAEGVYDVASLPYRAIGDAAGIDKGRADLVSGAPKPETHGEKLAEGAGQGIGATLPGMGLGGLLARSATPLVARAGAALAERPLAQLATGAASGALDVDHPGAGGYLAMAVPGAGTAARAAKPNLNQLTGDQARLVALAKQHGIPLTAADLTNNRMLHLGEGVLKVLPGSSGVMHKVDKAQREAFNRAVLDVAGIKAPYATPDELQSGYKKLGTEMNALASLSNANLDRQWATEVDRVTYDYGRRLSTDQAPVFKSYLDDLSLELLAARGGGSTPLSGERYDEIRKGMARRYRQTRDPTLKDALHGMMDALDGAMERTAPAGLRPMWADTRRRYAALATIEDAMSRGSQEDRSAGNIPFTGLEVAARSGDRRGFARGQGQLNDLARVGMILAPKVPSSGTAERSQMQRMLTGAAPASALTYGVTTGDFVSPAVAMATPYAAAKAYNTEAVQKWLSSKDPFAQILKQGLVRTLTSTVPQAAREESEGIAR